MPIGVGCDKWLNVVGTAWFILSCWQRQSLC